MIDLPWYHAALLVGYAVAGVLAMNIPRAMLWTGASLFVVQASFMWWQAGLPNGAFVGGLLNLAICFALYALARRRWEMRLWNCYHLMIILDILYLSGLVERSHFVIALEMANWLAIAIIGGAGIMERVSSGNPGLLSDHRLRHFRDALHAKRACPPFWQA